MKGESLPLGEVESDVMMNRLPPFDPSSALVTGFDDCGEEAVRYLMEVEKLPADHPLIVGLRMHLNEQRKALYLANMMAVPPEFSAGSNYSLPAMGETDVSHLPVQPQFDSTGPHSIMTIPDSVSHVDFLPPHQDFVPSHQLLPNLSETDSLIKSLAEEIFSLLEEDDGFYDDDDEEEMSYGRLEHSLQATEQ